MKLGKLGVGFAGAEEREDGLGVPSMADHLPPTLLFMLSLSPLSWFHCWQILVYSAGGKSLVTSLSLSLSLSLSIYIYIYHLSR